MWALKPVLGRWERDQPYFTAYGTCAVSETVMAISETVVATSNKHKNTNNSISHNTL